MPEVDRVEVKVTPDLDEFRAKVHAELSKIRDLKVGLDPDVTGFRQKVQAELAGMRASVGLDVDRDSMGLRVAQAQMQAQASANPIKIGVDVDRDSLRRTSRSLLSWTGSAFRFAGTTTAIAGIGIAGSTAAAGLGAMVLQAVPLAAALSQAAGAAALIPAALGGGAAVIGTLVVGMNGVADAFKNSGDPEKYAEALAKLAPAAQDFVTAGVGMKGVFSDLRKEVQQNLFVGLGDELRNWNTSLIPSLRRGMANVASGLNDAAKSIMAALGDPSVAASIQALFSNTGKGASAAAGGFGAFTEGFAALAAGGSEFFAQLGQGFTNAGTQFSRWVDKITTNGDLERWVRNGIEAFQNLGQILGNIGSGLAGIFRAANQAGGNMLARWADVTDSFASWANSSSGQAVLSEFFTAVGDITSALTPVAQSLLGVVASISSGVAGIATAFAPFASKVLDNLNPVIDTLAGILTDIAPPFGEFLDVISQSLGPAFANLGPGVKDLFGALADSAPAIGSILESVGSIGGAVLSGIADVLPGIADGLASFAGFLADVVDAIGPVPAAIAAFVAALAISGVGGAAGGLGFLGKMKAVAGVAGLFGLWDVATKDLPKDAADAGVTMAEGIASGAAAGFAVGGPIGALFGGIAGLAVSQIPTYKEAGKTLANNFKVAFGGELAEGESMFVLNEEAIKKAVESGNLWQIVTDGLQTKVHGKASIGMTEDQIAARKKQLEGQKEYNKAIEELYKLDAEAAKKYDKQVQDSATDKYDVIDEKAKLSAQVSADVAAKKAEFAQRGYTQEQIAAEAAIEAESQKRKEAAELQRALHAKLGIESSEWSRKSVSESKKSADSTNKAWGDVFKDVVTNANAAEAGTTNAWGRAASSAGSSASTTKSWWDQTFLAVQQNANATANTQQNAWGRAAASASSSAGSAAGSWLWFGSAAGGSVDAFYRKFNNSIPQSAAASQASGAAAQWSGMYGTGSGLGALFGQGLAVGINSQYGAVANAAARLARAAADATAAAARVASPSKVMIELGEYMGEGFAIGIESKTAQVRSAAKSLAGAASTKDLIADPFGVGAGGQAQFNIVDVDGGLLTQARTVSGRAIKAYDTTTSHDVRFARAY